MRHIECDAFWLLSHFRCHLLLILLSVECFCRRACWIFVFWFLLHWEFSFRQFSPHSITSFGGLCDRSIWMLEYFLWIALYLFLILFVTYIMLLPLRLRLQFHFCLVFLFRSSLVHANFKQVKFRKSSSHIRVKSAQEEKEKTKVDILNDFQWISPHLYSPI